MRNKKDHNQIQVIDNARCYTDRHTKLEYTETRIANRTNLSIRSPEITKFSPPRLLERDRVGYTWEGVTVVAVEVEVASIDRVMES